MGKRGITLKALALYTHTHTGSILEKRGDDVCHYLL